MTREETVKIIRIMVDSYPNYKPNDISETVDVWQMMLGGIQLSTSFCCAESLHIVR